MITHICFDADDTLWHNESYFQESQAALVDILDDYAPREMVEARLHDTEGKNIHLFGYGVKGFTLSMVETAIELSEERISAADIHRIIQLGKRMLDAPMILFDGVVETLDVLRAGHPLYLITKGDLFDQNNKIARSGLRGRFVACEVVSEKDPETYAEVFARHGLPVESTLMVGNSLPHDCMPVIELGGHGAHIPFEHVAFFDRSDPSEAHPRLHRLESIRECLNLLAEMNNS